MPRRQSRIPPEQSETDFGVPIPGVVLPQDQWARTAIKRLPPPGPLDFSEIFGRAAPLVLDLGCGNGRFTLTSALRRPEANHLAIDILPLVVRYATRRANQRGLANVRFAVIGGYELLDAYVASHTIQEIHLYHPQPYHDAERAAKRLVTPAFLALVHRALVPGGLFVLQTDNRGYWDYIQRVAPHFFDWRPRNTPWPDAPQGRTRREIYARQHKLTVYRGEGITEPQLTATSIASLVASLPQPRFDA